VMEGKRNRVRVGTRAVWKSLTTKGKEGGRQIRGENRERGKKIVAVTARFRFMQRKRLNSRKKNFPKEHQRKSVS